MSSKGTEYRNLILISQVSISIMVPLFLCVVLGVWLDSKFGTWFSVPLVFLGIAAGARNAYVLVMNVVKSDEKKRLQRQNEEIMRKVEKAKKQEKEGK